MKQLLIKLLISMLLVFAPLKATIIVVMVLTLIDFVTGVRAAQKRGEAITSGGFKRTIFKILGYELVVMLGFLVEQYMTGDMVPVTKVLAGLIGITELKSVIENLQDVTGVPLSQLLLKKLNQVEHQDIPDDSE